MSIVCVLGIRLLVLWVLGASFLFGPARALADAKDEARILFEAGVAASRAERWLEASEYFRRSLSLVEKPSTWFNLAVAELKQAHGSAALAALEAFERSANVKDHADMLERAPALRAQAEALPEAAPPPGPGGAPASEPDADRTELAAAPPVSSPAEGAEAAPPTTPSEPSHLGPPRKLIGAGVVTLLASVGAFGYWVNRSRKRDACEAEIDRCTNLAPLQAEARAGLGLGVGLAIVSVGLTTAGTTWLLREKGKDGRSASSASLRLSPRSLEVSWRF